MKKKLAIITTHPIQYNAPLFELLTQRNNIEIKVFYTWGEEALEEKFDHGFGKTIKWDIDLLSGYPYEFLVNVAKEKGSHHFNGINNPFIIEKIKAFNPSAILVFGWPLKSHYKVMRHFKGKIPVYFRGDSVLKKSDGLVRKILKKIYISWIYKSIDKAFFTGVLNKDYFNHYGIQNKNLVYAPHAINNAFFINKIASNENAGLEWRRSLSIKDEAVVFLYAGKLDQNKNTHFLLTQFLLLNNPSTHIVIAGDGEEKMNLMNEFDQYNNIHFLPFQNQSAMPFLYDMCDVFVLPSKNETWGLSVNEAMACGKAVIVSSDVGAGRDLIDDGVNGLVFDIDAMNSLLEKLNLLSDKNIAASFGIQSAQKINNWNFNKIAEAFEFELSRL